jgi:hypothetical protein
MSRLLFLIILATCVVVFGVIWYTHWSNIRSLTSGAVVVHDQTSDKAKADLATPEAGTSGQAPPDQHPQTPAKGAHPAQIDGTLATPPSADSNPRNPPNGMIFAGRGKYQLYRQGDITWRLNTDNGQACILFATDAEWSQPRVFQQGCGAK